MTDLERLLGSGEHLATTRTKARGPEGRLPITPEMLLAEPSGNLFGMTQDAGMGWNPAEVNRAQVLIVSTQGGLRDADGRPVALGFHTGHWEIGLLVRAAAETLREEGVVPFAAYCSDPCDGRTQGTVGMFDSLPYRNDAAITMRRLIRSLPRRAGVMGIATCDKGLPATMIALAGCRHLPGIVVPGGVTLPAIDGEDAGKVQTIGARFAHGLIAVEDAAAMGCRACGTPGGGCQFLGTAATSQVVAEAIGMTLPHSALCPSGEPVWLDMARRSARALVGLVEKRIPLSTILTQQAIENAMLVHAAFGGSTNLLLHIPALAYAAGLERPTVEDWRRINRMTPRLVDALPNGPLNHPTVQVFMAGGVPEVMLHLRRMGLLHLDVLTVTGEKLGAVLDWWEGSERRRAARARLHEADGVDPDRVIMSADVARANGLSSTVVFPQGNIAPEGSLIKATGDRSVGDGRRQRVPPSRTGAGVRLGARRDRGNQRHRRQSHQAQRRDRPDWCRTTRHRHGGDLSAHVGAEVHPVGQNGRARDGRPVLWCVDRSVHRSRRARSAGGRRRSAKLIDGDLIDIVIDRRDLTGQVNLVAAGGRALEAEEARQLLAARPSHPELRPHADLPDDTRLWAALQSASGGPWAGCVYDVDRIIEVIHAGLSALQPK